MRQTQTPSTGKHETDGVSTACHRSNRHRGSDFSEGAFASVPLENAESLRRQETMREGSDEPVDTVVKRMVHVFRHGTPEAFELEVARFGEDRLREVRTADVGK